MKQLIMFFFSFSLACFLNAKEDRCSDCEVHEKIYVDPSQVQFAEHQIYVNMNDLWIQTRAVHADENGFYIDSFQQVDETSYSWTCRKCGKNNENYRETCRKCGEPKP